MMVAATNKGLQFDWIMHSPNDRHSCGSIHSLIDGIHRQLSDFVDFGPSWYQTNWYELSLDKSFEKKLMISRFFSSDNETSHDSHRATSRTNQFVAARLNSHQFNSRSFSNAYVVGPLLSSEDQLERQSSSMRIQVNDGRAEDDLHRCSSSLSPDMRRQRMQRRSEEGNRCTWKTNGMSTATMPHVIRNYVWSGEFDRISSIIRRRKNIGTAEYLSTCWPFLDICRLFSLRRRINRG